jgi:hypothetical protein
VRPLNADLVAPAGGACWEIPYAAIGAELKLKLFSSLATRMAELIAEQAWLSRLTG